MNTNLRLALLTFFTVFWLVPFFWTGRMGKLPFRIPQRLLSQYACAGLFTKRTWNWNQPLVQVRHMETGEWETLAMEELSPLGAYGYRQRIDRLLLKTGGSKMRNEIRQRLAAWVSRRYAEAHPERGEVQAVRIAQNVWPVNCVEMAHPEGHWVPNPASLGPNGRFEMLAAFAIRDGKATPLLPNKGILPSLTTPSIFARRPTAPTSETKP